MKFKISIIAFVLIAAFSSCKKEENWAEDWVGTYNGTAGGAIHRVIVSEVDNKTLRLDLQALVSGTYYTFATIASANLTSETAFTVDENGTIVTSPGETYHFAGTGGLNGNTLTFGGSAQNINDSNDLNVYAFTGSK